MDINLNQTHWNSLQPRGYWLAIKCVTLDSMWYVTRKENSVCLLNWQICAMKLLLILTNELNYSSCFWPGISKMGYFYFILLLKTIFHQSKCRKNAANPFYNSLLGKVGSVVNRGPDHMVTKRRCIWNEAFPLGPIVWNKVHASFLQFS